MSTSELVCQLNSALESCSREAELPALLLALERLLDDPQSEAASELNEILMDAWPLLMAAAARSAAAEAAAHTLLAALARHCTAREVFTLCMASLAEHVRWAQTPAHARLHHWACRCSSPACPASALPPHLLASC